MKVMNRRTNAIPERSDVLYIMKNYHHKTFRQMSQHLNASEKLLIRWCKFCFDNHPAESKWMDMKNNLNMMDLLSGEDSMLSEYDWYSIKRVGKNTKTDIKRIVNDNRMIYMVTINHEFHYIVKFDIPVDRETIQYSKYTMNCDYEVSALGHWEYSHLHTDLPVVEITADENYIHHFWLALSNMVHYEA